MNKSFVVEVCIGQYEDEQRYCLASGDSREVCEAFIKQDIQDRKYKTKIANETAEEYNRLLAADPFTKEPPVAFLNSPDDFTAALKKYNEELQDHSNKIDFQAVNNIKSKYSLREFPLEDWNVFYQYYSAVNENITEEDYEIHEVIKL